MLKTTCPACGAQVSLKANQTIKGAVVECQECEEVLRVVSDNPLKLAMAESGDYDDYEDVDVEDTDDGEDYD
ncbi:MAG TPA: lysine biosynthesis protein LysW [Candidatus Bipolaricaulota bacterium]